MARPIKYNVDYFPHYISTGKKMSVLQSRYGNDGYAVWFKLLEQLAHTDFHYLDLNKILDLHYLAKNICLVSEETLINILDDLADFGEINADLWKVKIIWSEKFINSVSDAYKRRECKTKDLAGLLQHIKDTKPQLAGLLHTLIPIKAHEEGLMYIEPTETHSISTERERDREIKEKEIEKEKKYLETSSDHPSIEDHDLDKIFPDSVISVETVIKLLKSERWGAWRDRFGMKKSVFPDKLFVLLDLFEEHLKDQNQLSKSTRDAQLHFVSWYDKVYLKNIQKEAMITKNGGEKPAHEGIDRELVGKWIWRFGDWRDTTTFTKKQLRDNGLK